MPNSYPGAKTPGMADRSMLGFAASFVIPPRRLVEWNWAGTGWVLKPRQQ
jgi:hypothetical protein